MTISRITLLLLPFISLAFAVDPPYGQLSVKGNKIVGANGQEVALHGMSLFWSQWSEGSVFYNRDTVSALKCSWNANLVRAAMGVEEGGYLTNPSGEQAKLEAVVDAAIAEGIYVIIDWHDHNAAYHTDKAVEFFSAISKKYTGVPNVIYETFNEPLQVSWNDLLKPYHTAVVNAIRANDKNNLIVLGTPTWSQDVDVASQNPVSGTNLAYTLHYYAASHKQDLRNKAQTALNNGIALFVTEYGTVDASGGGSVDQTSSNEWWTFLDNNKISYANWAIDNKAEAAAALTPGTTAQQVGDDSRLTASGKFVKDKLKSQNNGVSCSGSGSATTVASGQTTTTTKSPDATTTTTKAADATTKATTQASNDGGNNGGSEGVSVSVQTVNSWQGGGQYALVFKNTGSSDVCGADFTLTLPSGVSIANNWNFNQESGNQYTLPDWVRISPGNTFQDAGLVVNGNGQPSIGIVSVKQC